MKKLVVSCILCFLIFITLSCTKGTAQSNNVQNENRPQVFTLDEKNKVIYLDFTTADMNLLENYSGDTLSTSKALSILDADTYSKFPKDVRDQLETIKWTWNTKDKANMIGGIISYD